MLERQTSASCSLSRSTLEFPEDIRSSMDHILFFLHSSSGSIRLEQFCDGNIVTTSDDDFNGTDKLDWRPLKHSISDEDDDDCGGG